jgi:chromosome segregation ATPase
MTSGGGDVFAQARRLLDHLEREFRARESALDSREAALASREEELANARAVFQETVQRASTQHKGAVAVLEMKTRELYRLQEVMNRDAEITNAGLDQHRRKTKALSDKLIEQRALLEDREASAAEATAKLQSILVAVLAAEKKSAQVSELQRTLEKRERVVAALWDDLAVKDKANTILDGALKSTVEQLGEATRREAAAREETAGALARLAGKEEEADARRAADLERTLQEHGSGMARLGEAVDRAANAMRGVGMVPAERPADTPHGELEDHARFLDSLSGQLAGLRAAFEDTLVREGKQVAEAMATHILARLHHRDPSWPLDAIFTRIPQADREGAEAAVASHIAELVRRIARSLAAP